jgi:hypothetical protein
MSIPMKEVLWADVPPPATCPADGSVSTLSRAALALLVSEGVDDLDWFVGKSAGGAPTVGVGDGADGDWAVGGGDGGGDDAIIGGGGLERGAGEAGACVGDGGGGRNDGGGEGNAGDGDVA